ncbi:MAG: hypothetical protein ACRD8O_16170 [Bryobacteraceae bacterium]
MPKTAKPTPRVRRSKPEIETEFEQIQKQVSEERLMADPKLEAVRASRDGEARAAVDGITVEAVVQKISGLGLEVSKALSSVSEQLVQEVDRLAAVREAVALEQKELDRLHKIDVAATALDQLVQDYSRQRQELETEIAAQRTAWDEESKSAERERKEQEELQKKVRQREVDDFEYKKTQERKKAQDKYEEDLRLQEKRNKEKQEGLEKEWHRRESELKAREEELARLQKESAGFPARLQKEVDEAVAKASKAAQASFEQQLLISKKDAEADKRVAELRATTLEETLKRQSAQMEALERQLSEAKQQVQEIALRAIEGASGAKALSHINQIAMEQAKNRESRG